MLFCVVFEIGDWGDFLVYEVECYWEIIVEFYVFLIDDFDVVNSIILV